MIAPPSMQEIFAEVFRRRAWGGDESVSGPGSGLARTSAFRDQISELLRELGAATLLDAGCGDFHWMSAVEFQLDQYIGVDVVCELITENKHKYGNDRRAFLCLDVARDPLPACDVILSRDCLVHFSFRDIFDAVINFQRSGSTYLLTTTFVGDRRNLDIKTGEWRPLNLQAPPFGFPAPLALIDEKCIHTGGIYADKRLALWELGLLPQEHREQSSG